MFCCLFLCLHTNTVLYARCVVSEHFERVWVHKLNIRPIWILVLVLVHPKKITIGMAQEESNNHCHMHLNSYIVSMFPAGDATWCPEPWKVDLIGIFQGCSFRIDTRSENQWKQPQFLTQGVSVERVCLQDDHNRHLFIGLGHRACRIEKGEGESGENLSHISHIYVTDLLE